MEGPSTTRPSQPTLRATGSIGSYDSYRAALNFGGTSGALNYVLDLSHFETNGYRDHSAAVRDQFNSKFRLDLASGAKLTAVINALDQPDTQDPLGLTRAQFDRRPASCSRSSPDPCARLARTLEMTK